MAKKKKAKSEEPDEFSGWNPRTGSGQLQGSTKFAKPPCPVDTNGYHQYTDEEETKVCRVWRCRLCGRTLTVNRKTGNVREREERSMRPRVRKIGGLCHRIRLALVEQGWKWCRRCKVWHMPPESDPDHCRHCERKQTLSL